MNESKKKETDDGLKIVKTTLQKLGANLPLGVSGTGGELGRGLAVRPWRMREEKELGAMREENENINVAQYVAMVLGKMCTKLGPYDFEKMDLDEKRLRVGQMFMGDVFYAYCWLRYQALGETLKLKITCPGCRKNFDFEADLRTLEIATAGTIEAAKWSYKLRVPIEVRGKTVEELVMGPARWNTMETLGEQSVDTGKAKSAIICGSVHKLVGNDELTMIAEGELDELDKYDVEKLTDLVDTNAIGPNMAIEGKCPKCKRKFKSALGWGYDDFFDISSQ